MAKRKDYPGFHIKLFTWLGTCIAEKNIKKKKKHLLWFGIRYSHEQCLWKVPKCTFLRQVQRHSSDKKPPWQHCQYKDSCLSRLFFFFLKLQFSTKGESSFLNRIFSNWRYTSLHTRTVLEKCHKSQTTPVLQVPTHGILKDIGTFFFLSMCNKQEPGQSTALQLAKQAFPRYTNQK